MTVLGHCGNHGSPGRNEGIYYEYECPCERYENGYAAHGLSIKDLAQLEFISTKIRRLKDVYSVERFTGGSSQ